MKKSIRPPENWQDFETLCKKLFGEIWKCSHTIKKNGRLGQPQSGVDIYGKPKGESDYWGIQCKGKDNYLDAKLTEQEIDDEIKKALFFEPKLKVFIFTTTAPKDVNIEKYIRIKDQESCKNGNFEIVLYSWQDLADLIDENKDTFNWYVNNIQFKEQFDIEIKITTQKGENILTPKFLKTITDYKLSPNPQKQIEYIVRMPDMKFSGGLFGSSKKNHGWCELLIIMKNTGSIVLEDWKFIIDFGNSVHRIDDSSPKGINLILNKDLIKYTTTWAYEDEKKILYKPLNNSPLIQKDSKSFNCFCIPYFESSSITINWQLLARDFDREGEIVIPVSPLYKIEKQTKFVDDESKIRVETNISKYTTLSNESDDNE
ncbi:MAG: hypothetical protein A2033_13170 [Bacteroidetes bacterium GWA2_31_9]|nr:MAG: hypothetical protein A2033_13170 [Bacteroidetes bacterium GWA2_31_9]